MNGFGFYGDELIASQSLTPEQFGTALMSDPRYGGGPIRLLACDAAAGMAAQRLANTMGVEVLAPTTETYTTFDGRVETVNGGTFVRVVPNYP